ncbi:MAG: glycosyltransferase family 39 protein [Candidatus Dormibacteria bacterium]
MPTHDKVGTVDDPRYTGKLIAITVAGLVLRGAFLDRQPLWRDEAFTAIVVQRPTGDMLGAVSRDSAPPLQYLLEHAVAQFSAAPWALRLISAIAGTALIPIAAALARRAAGGRAGLWTAAVVALLPTTVVVSRDARMYALAGTLVCASLLLLWRALDRPTWPRVAVYALVTAAAVWTQYFAVIALVAHGIATVWILRPSWRRVTVAAGAAMVAVLSLTPWLLMARAQFQHTQTPFWIEPVGLKTVSGTVIQFLSGPPIDPGVPLKIGLQTLQGIAVIAGLAGLLTVALGRGRLQPQGRRGIAFLAVSGGGALLLLLLISLGQPLLEARYASVLWPPLFAVIGIGISVLPLRAALVSVLAMAVPSLALSLAITHPQTADVLPSHLGAHDIILADPSQYLLAQYYATPDVATRVHVLSGDVPWYWGTAAFPPGAITTAVPGDVVANSGTIVMLTEPEDELPSLPHGYTATAKTCAVRVCLTVAGHTG